MRKGLIRNTLFFHYSEIRKKSLISNVLQGELWWILLRRFWGTFNHELTIAKLHIYRFGKEFPTNLSQIPIWWHQSKHSENKFCPIREILIWTVKTPKFNRDRLSFSQWQLFIFYLFFYFFYFFFLSFYHNKIHPVTYYKAIKNKINNTRQHRTIVLFFLFFIFIFFNKQSNNNKTKKTKREKQ